MSKAIFVVLLCLLAAIVFAEETDQTGGGTPESAGVGEQDLQGAETYGFGYGGRGYYGGWGRGYGGGWGRGYGGGWGRGYGGGWGRGYGGWGRGYGGWGRGYGGWGYGGFYG